MAKEFGSLNNLLLSGSRGAPAPTVGMGATILSWSDRSPATVVEVSASGKTIKLQEDTATRTDTNGMSECQDYAFAPDPSAPLQVARLTSKGWKIVGGSRVRLGERSRYHDFSF